MRHMQMKLISSTCLCIAVAHNAAAQDALQKIIASVAAENLTMPSEKAAATPLFDLSVPDNPLFSLFGTPKTIIDARTVQNLDFSLLNGQAVEGALQTGVGAEFNLYNLITKSPTLDEYQAAAADKTTGLYALYNTAVSIAVSKGIEDDNDAWRAGFGIRTTIFDTSDAIQYTAYENCFAREMTTEFRSIVAGRDETDDGFEEGRFPLPEDAQSRLDEKALALHGECSAEYREKANLGRRNHRFDVGLATIGASSNMDDSLDDIDFEGGTIWATYSFNLIDDEMKTLDVENGRSENVRSFYKAAQDDAWEMLRHAEFAGHLRYELNSTVVEDGAAAGTFNRDALTIAGSLKVGGDISSLAFEGGYVMEDNKNGRDDDEYFRYTAELGFRVSGGEDPVHAFISAGSTAGREDGNEGLFLGGLRYRFGTPSF